MRHTLTVVQEIVSLIIILPTCLISVDFKGWQGFCLTPQTALYNPVNMTQLKCRNLPCQKQYQWILLFGFEKMKEKRFELKYNGNNFFLMLNFLVSTTTMLQRGSCFLMTLSLCHDSEMAVQILCLQWTASNGGRKKTKQKGTLGCAKDMK